MANSHSECRQPIVTQRRSRAARIAASLLAILFGLFETIATQSVAVAGSPQDVDDVKRREFESEVADLVDATTTVPAEIGADVFLRLLESPVSRDAVMRLHGLALVEGLIANVTEPTRRRLIVGEEVESENGSRHLAMLLGLDRVSLSLRLVRVLLNLDPAIAKQRFTEVYLAFPPTACASRLVPEVTDYYRTLRSVFSEGFDQADRDAGEHLLFLESHLRLSSATQIKPVADLLVALQLPGPDWDRLLSGFAGDLQTLTADDRSFSDNTIADTAAVLNLARVAESRGVASTTLLTALRTYLVRHASAIRCANSMDRRTALSDKTLTAVNMALSGIPASVPPPPITEREIEPIGLDEEAVGPGYWLSDSARALNLEAAELRFPNRREITNRPSYAWRERFYRFLNRLVGWTGTDERSPTAYRNQKAILFESFLSVSLTDTDRALLLRDWCAFLSEWYTNATRIDEWLYRSRPLLESRANPAFLGITQASCLVLSNPVISLYHRVDELLANSNR